MIARKETRLITNRKSNNPEAQNPPMATKLSQFAGSLRGYFDSIVHMKTMIHTTWKRVCNEACEDVTWISVNHANPYHITIEHLHQHERKPPDVWKQLTYFGKKLQKPFWYSSREEQRNLMVLLWFIQMKYTLKEKKIKLKKKYITSMILFM